MLHINYIYNIPLWTRADIKCTKKKNITGKNPLARYSLKLHANSFIALYCGKTRQPE